MFRAVNAFVGFVLFFTGLFVTAFTMNADGWTVLAAVGVVMLAVDIWVEERSYTRGSS